MSDSSNLWCPIGSVLTKTNKGNYQCYHAATMTWTDPFVGANPNAVMSYDKNVYQNLGNIEYDVAENNWVGPLEKPMLSDAGKLTFGPAPQGIMSEFEPMILLVALVKLGQTPDGRQIVKDIAVKYLDTIGRIIDKMSQSSAAHVISCAMNQYVACTIYQRLGLMSPHDATETRAWLDHQTGEAMFTERAGQSLTALTTLVNATTESGGKGESATGLAAFAKILEKT